MAGSQISSNASRKPTESVPAIPLSEIALTGIYEISKILTAPSRLETTLSNVINLLSSFMQMRHGIISLLADDGVPDIVVGAGWSEGTDERYRARLPERAVGHVIATAVPLVAENVAAHPLFSASEVAMMAAAEGVTVSFIGVPIRAQAKVIGTLTIDRVWDGGSHFRLDSDVRFLTMISNLIGQTIQLHRVVSRDRERLIVESHRLQKELSAFKPANDQEKLAVSGIIGESPVIRTLLKKISIVAKSNSTVLLRGESGTGKEIFARAIHELSPRANRAFIKVNCAALPESVLESELFGHEKGAFTGALSQRKGRFELADKGTLFLDEIGEISPAFQAKLLRVLQEQEFERVGGTRTIKVDVRIVTATNKNLEEAVTNGQFRADLYYRISVVPLMLPAVRDRPGDIPLLAEAFLSAFNKENGRDLKFGRGAMEVLAACYFPGNVRELENCVQRTATLASGTQIVSDDFACHSGQCLSATLWKAHSMAAAEQLRTKVPLAVVTAPARAEPPLAEKPGAEKEAPVILGDDDASERARLVQAMEKAGWVQAKAARLLGLTPRQIGYALRKHDIPIKRL